MNNNLTTAELDKLDILIDEFVTAIKDQKFSPELEIFLRTELSGFMGTRIEKYNGNTQTTGATY